LATALSMPADERATRAQSLKKMASARTPMDWFADQLGRARQPES
ncbi:MAG: hypothetical protein QOJ52_3238, partial [Acidimicrobiaceae bacterium]|nr:hypothetical protein [Acidimicrobiaceae bacterium]